MGKITGFMELARIQEASLPPQERVSHYREFVLALDDDAASKQGARCMDCGIPFCQSGCPVNNIIPDWNDLVYRSSGATRSTCCTRRTTFPSSPAASVPAPCEEACTLNINDDPVGIKSIEHFIIDKGWEEGWVVPLPPATKTGKRVAVVGSGPAGLACAQQLARAGHDVVLYEKADRIGGLLRYGIPDFKMERHLIDRRMAQMSIEGVEFRPGVHVGKDVAAEALVAEYDAVVLTGGAEAPRDLPVPGRDLAGIHFAMEFLPQQNRVDRRRQGAGPDPRDGQARRRHRRRRHGLRLRRHVESPAREVDHAVRAPAAAAGAGEQAAHVAVLADQAADLVVAPGRLRARLGGRDQALRRQERTRREARRGARRMAQGRGRRDEDGRGPGLRVRDEGRSRAARDGLRRPGARRTARSSSASRTTRAATCAPTRKTIERRCRRSSRPATCAAASRSWCGRSARDGSARAPSISFLMGSTELPR